MHAQNYQLSCFQSCVAFVCLVTLNFYFNKVYACLCQNKCYTLKVVWVSSFYSRHQKSDINRVILNTITNLKLWISYKKNTFNSSVGTARSECRRFRIWRYKNDINSSFLAAFSQKAELSCRRMTFGLKCLCVVKKL